MEPDSKNLTPEERLLKIIQDNEASEKHEDTMLLREESGGGISRRRPLGSRLPFRFGFGRAVSGFSHGFQASRGVLVQTGLSLRTVNGLLFLLFAGLFAYFLVGQILFSKSPGGKLMAKAQVSSAAPMEDPSELFEAREVDENYQTLADRNVFQPYRSQEKPRPVPTPEPQPAASNLAAIASTMKLSGTYLSDQNEALIELLDEKRTVSVPQGGTLKGVTVKEVRSDSVVLSDGVTEFTLQ